MVTQAEVEERDRLAYLALYYAINGDEQRSEQIRRIVRNLVSADSTEENQVSVNV